MERVSVIVPMYNVEKYISTCIESICNQTYRNLEILLVDDGSTDNTGIIAEEYSKRDSRIQYFKKENGGISDARNFGIEKSQGTYLTFIDSDDWIQNTYVEDLLSSLKKYDGEIAIANHIKYDDNERMYYFHVSENDYYEKVYTQREFLVQLPYLEMQDNSFPTSWGILFKRNLFDTIRFPLGRINEDLAINYRMCLKTNKIIYIHKALYVYRIREGSYVKAPLSEKRLRDSLEMLEERIVVLSYRGYDISAYLEQFRHYLIEFTALAAKEGLETTPTFKRHKELIELFNLE